MPKSRYFLLFQSDFSVIPIFFINEQNILLFYNFILMKLFNVVDHLQGKLVPDITLLYQL